MAQVAQLVELSVFGDKIERDIIVSGNIPLFQLHRVLQFCIKNRQSDDTIAAQPFTFWHLGDDGSSTELKGTKSKKLCQANPTGVECLEIADRWQYTAGKVTVTLTVTDCAEPARAIFCYDTRHNLPRCITATGGSDDLDAINKKLITRYFTQAGAKKGATKRPQALWCSADTSNASLWASHMNHMLRPLRGHPWEQSRARF